jgi:hypothetical protein
MKRKYDVLLYSNADTAYVVLSVKPYVKIKTIKRKVPDLQFPKMIYIKVPVIIDVEGSVEICDDSINYNIVTQLADIAEYIFDECERKNLVEPDGFDFAIYSISTDEKSAENLQLFENGKLKPARKENIGLIDDIPSRRKKVSGIGPIERVLTRNMNRKFDQE